MSRRIVPAFFLGVAALTATANHVAAQVIDNFSDLNDTANPAWTHLSGLVGSTGQTWDASTGKYHLIAPNNGLQINANGQLGYVASYVPTSFTDVIVSADFVQNTTGAAYGVTARIDGAEGINLLKGYAYAYEPFAGVAGEMTLFRITGANLTDLGNTPITLDLVNKDYTFSLEIVGDQLHGRVYEIGGGLVTEKTATDATYTSGFSGLFGYSAVATGVQTDFTIDNFSATVPSSNAIPGDFDSDDDVDGDDLAIWKTQYGAVSNGADANGDGVTDGADFLIWQRQYTGSLGPAAPVASAVPEPATLLATSPAVVFLMACATRRRRAQR
ncbi:hypothetical protein [Lacipirellula sp.]|uniref:hypothetical protein n=1 Tax=Lacipirellula sp. TaxID=2691419 RepID=UPI003D135BA8